LQVRLRIAGCALQVARVQILLVRPCSANALLAQILPYCVCCLCYGRVTSYLRFPIPRRPTKLRNPNPKHLNHMFNIDANRCDGAAQRTE
jgi:hypothetical protein